MTALQIHPSELRPSGDVPPPPRPGASVREWAAYRARFPRPAPLPVAPAEPPKRVKIVKVATPPPPPRPAPVVVPPSPLERMRAVARPPYEDGAPPITYIQRVVCAYYGVSRLGMVSDIRTMDMVKPRFVAMYLCVTLAKRTKTEIGVRFRKDHTTVIHSYRRILASIPADPDLCAQVEAIKAVLLDEVKA